ncbi:hypothetical protein [Tropicibacter oceani]|uniref:Uncharacterized protein n=1 Tax=Tropicibacter oceani TaxID=3058420 RepID=A0ABY8QGM8_9RHOB|nr:hypothetical protein [Tropicibacter oceani]WGW03685.1 hypothetical protein QF118_17470 [Tropicibacter oceani]
MKDLAPPPPQTALRPPQEVMRLSRMGAMFPTRLSFLRSLLRDLAAERARLTRPVWEIDEQGYGHAVYSITLGGRVYSLVAISSHLPDEMRSDRVIATAWDSAYVLYDGVPDADEIARIAQNAPRQEAGRFTQADLVLSRANKSVRLFSHVVDSLRTGKQPDAGLINAVGYLMRTTAVYGNGKFGIADRGLIEDRPGLSGPFAAEMLTVWMIRSFTHDLVEHLGGAPLDARLKRHLGIGNSTGLGMAPFLVSHPILLNNWMMARETALARVRAVDALTDDHKDQLHHLARRAALHLDEWRVPAPEHQARIDRIAGEWPKVQDWLSRLEGPAPLDQLFVRAQALSQDTQELLVALLLEPFPTLVDGLSDCMADPLGLRALPFAKADDLRRAIETGFAWALAIDFDTPPEQHQFWYVSEEKLEPRLGLRFEEPGAELESPLDIARRVQALHRALNGPCDLREFRAAHPEHELALRRVQINALHPYSEIHDNLIGAACLPIDMLRCKLAFFGATKFDPKSDRWTRIALAQGAPLPDDVAQGTADDWWLWGLHA